VTGAELADALAVAWADCHPADRQASAWRLGSDAFAALWAATQPGEPPPPGHPLLAGARLYGRPLEATADTPAGLVLLVPPLPAGIADLPGGLQRQVLAEASRIAARCRCATSTVLAALGRILGQATVPRVELQALVGNPLDPATDTELPGGGRLVVDLAAGPLAAADRWLRTPPERRWDCADSGHVLAWESSACRYCGLEVDPAALVVTLDGQPVARGADTEQASEYRQLQADVAELARRRGGTQAPAFVCPDCGARSWHPDDGRHGWCGRCQAFTGTVGPEQAHLRLLLTEMAAFYRVPRRQVAGWLRELLRPGRGARPFRWSEGDPGPSNDLDADDLDADDLDAAGWLDRQAALAGKGQDAVAVSARLAAVDATLDEAAEWEAGWDHPANAHVRPAPVDLAEVGTVTAVTFDREPEEEAGAAGPHP
jgi:hypothetical protein